MVTHCLYTTQINFEEKTLTERQMLSDISKTFDSLGWLSPVTISLKQLIERAREGTSSWDDELPSEIEEQYSKGRSKLISLKHVQLQWFVLVDGFSDKIVLHLFCDASENAFAFCFYVVATDFQGSWKSSLLDAKTKVVRMKTLSVPRLELSAALLGTRLIQSVRKSFACIPVIAEETFAWTDTTIVLCSLSKEPSRWSTCFQLNEWNSKWKWIDLESFRLRRILLISPREDSIPNKSMSSIYGGSVHSG